jgi:hypothetical protein
VQFLKIIKNQLFKKDEISFKTVEKYHFLVIFLLKLDKIIKNDK